MANTHTLIHTHAHMHTHTCTRTHTHNEWKSHINQSFQTSVCDQTDKPIVLKTESGGRGTQGCPGASSACCPPHLPWTAGSSQSLWSPGGGCLEEAAWRSGRGRPPAGWVLYQCPPEKRQQLSCWGACFRARAVSRSTLHVLILQAPSEGLRQQLLLRPPSPASASPECPLSSGLLFLRGSRCTHVSRSRAPLQKGPHQSAPSVSSLGRKDSEGMPTIVSVPCAYTAPRGFPSTLTSWLCLNRTQSCAVVVGPAL